MFEKELSGMFETKQVKYWISQVNCQGDEESLLACLHSGIGNHNCGKDERAKVINPRRACAARVTVVVP